MLDDVVNWLPFQVVFFCCCFFFGGRGWWWRECLLFGGCYRRFTVQVTHVNPQYNSQHACIFLLFQLAVRIVQPVFIGKIVGVFYDGVEDNRNIGYVYATVILCCAFFEAILHHPLFLELLRTGMNLRVAASALVYRKVSQPYIT